MLLLSPHLPFFALSIILPSSPWSAGFSSPHSPPFSCIFLFPSLSSVSCFHLLLDLLLLHLLYLLFIPSYSLFSFSFFLPSSYRANDSGLLTHKETLPVRSLVLGDIQRPGSEAAYKVGPLHCHGDSKSH